MAVHELADDLLGDFGWDIGNGIFLISGGTFSHHLLYVADFSERGAHEITEGLLDQGRSFFRTLERIGRQMQDAPLKLDIFQHALAAVHGGVERKR